MTHMIQLCLVFMDIVEITWQLPNFLHWGKQLAQTTPVLRENADPRHARFIVAI